MVTSKVNILDIAKQTIEQKKENHKIRMEKAYKIRESKNFQAFYARQIKETLDRINEGLKNRGCVMRIVYEYWEEQKEDSNLEAFYHIKINNKIVSIDSVGVEKKLIYTKYEQVRRELADKLRVLLKAYRDIGVCF